MSCQIMSFAAFVQRIVGDQRRNDGRAPEPRGAQARQHSGGVRKLLLAVGEDTVIVLEIDVDVQAIQRDPRLAVGLCNAFQACPIVIAVAALMEAEHIPRRHRTPPRQSGELVKNARDAIPDENVVVEFAVKSAENVPVGAICGRSVTDIEVRLRRVVEEQPVAVRRSGIGAGWRAIDLDQQRNQA